MRSLPCGVALVACASALVACNALLDLGDPPDTTLPGAADASVDAADDGPLRDGVANADADADAREVDGPPSAVPSGPCDLTKPFGAPRALATLNTNANEYDARFTRDERTVYFASNRADERSGRMDVYVATRADRTDSFGAATLVADVNLPGANTFAPSITDDGLSIYFNSDGAQGFGLFDIWVGTRPSPTDGRWTVRRVPGVNSPAWDANPMITGNGRSLYFFSNREGGTDDDRRLYVSRKGADDQFDTPVLLFQFDRGRSANVAVKSDELTLAFSSSRGNVAGDVREDIWLSRRATTTDNWEPPVAVTEVNSRGTDNPTWLSDDGCRMYLQSDRGGQFDLYVAQRP